MSRFDDAFERIQKLVHDFEANEAYYLSAGYQESEVRTDFIDKFWNALGWDVRHKFQTNPREQEVKVERNPDANATGRRADYAFYYKPDYRNPVFFVEAKKPSVKLHGPKGYHQILKYGKNAGTPIGVLMDFEEFHIVDCRYLLTEVECYPLAKIKSFHYKDFLDKEKFGDIYWIFSHEALEEGKLKAFTSSLPKLKGKGKVKIQAEAEKPIDEAFLATLEEYRLILAKAFKKADESLTAEELTEATQKVIDRLVFIRFLEDKNIEADYIVDQIAAKKGNAWKSFLAWSKELDVKYNGIVFKPNRIDSSSFNAPDEAVFSKLCEDISHQHSPYLFSYIPIEILGSIYERFLGKVVTATAKRADIEEKPEVRKAGGVYYTPKYIVEYIVANTVGKILDDKMPADCTKLRFADIACGSGSFLIAVYDAVLRHVEAYYNAHPDEARKQKCIEIDKDVFALSLAQKRQILLDNIFGVDIDNQAVEVAQLSLFLKLLESESGSLAGQLTFERTKILPDLSKNILCGNSLVEYDIEQLFPLTPEDEHKIKPFDFKVSFKDIMAKGGFDAIVGNPPYGALFSEYVQNYLRSRYVSAEYQIDSYPIFIERALKQLKPQGKFGYIVPSAWVSSVYNKNLRTLLATKYSIDDITIAKKKTFADATVETVLLILSNQLQGNNKFTVNRWDVEPNVGYVLEQEVIFNQDNHVFPIYSNPASYSLLKKISSVTSKMSDAASAVWGVKVYQKGKGKPKQIGFESEQKIFHSNEKTKDTHKPLIGGSDVKRYSLTWGGGYVDYGVWLAEPRTPEWFTGERILIREVTASGRIQAAITNDDYVFSNSVDGLKIVKSDLSTKFLLALLNSNVISYYHLYTSPNSFKDTFPKLLIKDLLNLPIPTLDLTNPSERKQHDAMVTLADQMLEAKKRLSSVKTESERTQLERKCEYLDNEIDNLVYRLYGLSEEEIKIVEGV